MSFWFVIGGSILLSIWLERATKKRRQKAKSGKRRSAPRVNTTPPAPSTEIRPDVVILQTSLQELSGFEFERLLALYFRDQGYKVEETGVGGKDGGVDLVLVDRRGERTAVQAKRHSDHNKVPVQKVREFVGAKRNHNCVLTLLITTSDLTEPAKKEAEQFHMEYWHGGLLELKLATWGKYNPTKQKQRAVRNEAATTREVICKCGHSMVIRKNKQGVSFYGCSRFPNCRHTTSI
ncbi:restriction system protein [Tumebacillus sp. BK434]|uniref:restriction endonuclease n=1 Tax=Tumebacillus sp. BK434 TaxID=2512169 RepID=UPI00104287A4|nr:restriction endonuclease [Tumebacillus sp. BK434]TCP54444.1 restriction system protein [Tumebacillus sp. BK434]